MRIAALVLAALALVACGPGKTRTTASGAPVAETVFAASSLTDVLTDAAKAYEADGHPAPVLSFAASSILARQIEEGARADVFISADLDWMDYLAERKLIDEPSRRLIASNTLVLIAHASAACTIDLASLSGFDACLGKGKIALAEPGSVPAGKYAKAAFEPARGWVGIEKSAVYSDSVRGVLRLVETGEAALGVVYRTDAIAGGVKVKVLGEFAADAHDPIVYPAAAVARAGGLGVSGFLDFLSSDKGQAVLAAKGFGPPPSN
jgi:molybdate transport system substrate-binding protein